MVGGVHFYPLLFCSSFFSSSSSYYSLSCFYIAELCLNFDVCLLLSLGSSSSYPNPPHFFSAGCIPSFPVFHLSAATVAAAGTSTFVLLISCAVDFFLFSFQVSEKWVPDPSDAWDLCVDISFSVGMQFFFVFVFFFFGWWG